MAAVRKLICELRNNLLAGDVERVGRDLLDQPWTIQGRRRIDQAQHNARTVFKLNKILLGVYRNALAGQGLKGEPVFIFKVESFLYGNISVNEREPFRLAQFRIVPSENFRFLHFCSRYWQIGTGKTLQIEVKCGEIVGSFEQAFHQGVKLATSIGKQIKQLELCKQKYLSKYTDTTLKKSNL